MKNNTIPVSEKHLLSLNEASQYSGIGINKLRRLARMRPVPGWVVFNGNRIMVKRRQFEKTLDMTDAI